MDELGVKQELADLGKKIGDAVAEQGEKVAKNMGEVQKLWDDFKKLDAQLTAREKAAEARMNDLEKLIAAGGDPQLSFSQKLRKSLMADDSPIKLFAKEVAAGNRGGKFRKAVGDLALTNFTGEMGTRQRMPGVVGSPYRVHARDILPSAPSTDRITEIIRHTGGEGGPAYHADGSLKAQTDMDFTLVEITAKRIAHFVRLAESWLNDYSTIVRYIETNLVEQLFNLQDVEILNGPGTANAINGIITQAATFTSPFGANPVSAVNNIDVLVAAFADLSRKGVNQGGFTPSVIFLNPIDAYLMMLQKDSQGGYVTPNLITQDTKSILGVTTLAHQAVPQGTFCVGDLNYCQLQFHEPLSVEVSMHDRDNFIRNMITIRAEESIKLIVMNPDAFVKDTFAAARGKID